MMITLAGHLLHDSQWWLWRFWTSEIAGKIDHSISVKRNIRPHTITRHKHNFIFKWGTWLICLYTHSLKEYKQMSKIPIGTSHNLHVIDSENAVQLIGYFKLPIRICEHEHEYKGCATEPITPCCHSIFSTETWFLWAQGGWKPVSIYWCRNNINQSGKSSVRIFGYYISKYI